MQERSRQSAGSEIAKTTAIVLGGWERSFWLVDQTHTVNFVVVAHVEGALEREALRAGLDALQARHPLLDARIEAEPVPTFRIGGAPPIPLREVARSDDEQWRGELVEELNAPFDGSRGPLARLVVLRGSGRSDLLLGFHHSAADGRSGMAAMRDLLRVASGGEPPPPLAAPARLEEVMGPHLRGPWHRARVFASIAAGLGRRPQRLPVDAAAERGRCLLLHASLDEAASQALRQRSRAEGSTVHGALCSALLRAVAGQLDEQEGTARPRVMGCYSPIDLRGELLDEDQRDALGFMTGMGLTFHRVDASRVDASTLDASTLDASTRDASASDGGVALAQEVGTRLRQMKARGDVLAATAIQSALSRSWDRQVAARRTPQVAAAVSNLGLVDAPVRYGDLRLRGLHFALSSNGWGTAPVITVATHDGRLQLNMTYSAPWVRQQWARRIFERTLGALGHEAPAGPAVFPRPPGATDDARASMKIAILGAGGAVGRSVAAALRERGRSFRVVGRRREPLEALFGDDPEVEIVTADLMTVEGVRQACRGVERVFYTVGVPYTQFDRLPPLMDAAIEGARAEGVDRFVLTSNVYAYGRPQRSPITEEHPCEPHTRKGRHRKAQEQRLLAAHARGDLRALIVRLPDFIGPDAAYSFAIQVFEAAIEGKTANLVGKIDLPHEFIYTPDIGPVFVELSERDGVWGQAWHCGGPGTISTRALATAAFEAAGQKPRIRAAGAGMVRMLGLFNAELREVHEMMYQWDEEPALVLDDSKLRAELGTVNKTPYDEAIRATVAALKARA